MLKHSLMTNKPTSSILVLNESCTMLQLQFLCDVDQGLKSRLTTPKFDVLINRSTTTLAPRVWLKAW